MLLFVIRRELGLVLQLAGTPGPSGAGRGCGPGLVTPLALRPGRLAQQEAPALTSHPALQHVEGLFIVLLCW